MKKLLLIALVAAGMTACMQSEELAVPQSEAISFGNAYLDNSVRGEAAADPSTNNDNIEDFSVWGFMTSNLGTVLTDETVEKQSNNAWAYANVQYWMPEKDYYFSALSPADGDWDHNEVVAATEGLSNVQFTNEEGKIDLLYAYATAETPAYAELTNNGMPAVTMGFKHTLSKVKFTFANDFKTDNMFVEVKNVKMVVPQSGTVDFCGANANVWNLGEGTTTLAFGDTELISYQDTDECTTELFTIPASADYSYSVKFDLYVYTGKADSKELAFEALGKEATISGYALEMGRAYNFVASINPSSLNLHEIVFTAEVEDWKTPTVEVPVGYYVSENGTYVVTTESGLAQIAEEINAGDDTGRNIALGGDIDLNTVRSLTSNWTPIGSSEVPFTGTFDGNGYTIKNLTLVEEEAKEGKAYVGFFGYAKNATIKNVVFENVTINIPCLDIDHSQGHIGAVAGSLEGTSTIENVTVKGDIKVEATQNANGASRVAVVAGGNSYGNVTIKNVHVIANEGSYLIANNNTGAIAGQLQGKTVYENCSSNIDVTVNKFYAGGIVGLAGTNDVFTNCHTTGNIAVVAGREGRHNDEYRVGGIAGGWSDGKKNVLTLVNCSFTGNISGKNSDGTVAEVLDYMGYVGRGYTLANCAGSKVVIDGTEYVQKSDTVYGVYTINGLTPVSTADELVAALAAGEGVYFLNDITVAATKGGYEKAGILQNKAQTIDGGGHTLTVTGAGGTWDCGIYTNGGLIKNLTVAGSFRGIFTAGQSKDLYIDNVVFKKVIYTFNSDGKMPANPFGVYVSNSALNGWTSHSNMHTEVVYTNCSFCEGSGYAFCRAYGYTVYEGCSFSQDFELDTKSSKSLVFKGCTHNGVEITAENALTLGGVDKNGNEVVFLYNGIGNLTIE